MGSIKTRLLIAFLFLVTVPFLTYNLVGYFMLKSDYSQYMIENNRVITTTVAKNVQTFMEKAYRVSELLAQNNDVIGFDGEKQKQVLTTAIKSNPYFDLLYIQGTDGMQTARSSGNLANRANRWWFQKIMAAPDKPFVSKSYYSMTGNMAVSSVILPIYREGRLTGVFGSDLKLDALQDLVEGSIGEQGRYAYIIDSEGTVVAHPDKTQVSETYNYKTMTRKVLVKDSQGKVVVDASGNQKTEELPIDVPVALQDVAKKALAGESNSLEYSDKNGHTYFSTYIPVQMPGYSDRWAVITVQEKQAAMAMITDFVVKNIVLASLIIIASVFVAFRLAQSITEPIQKIEENIKKIAEGDLTEQVEVSGDDELGRLAANINHMVSSTGYLVKDIRKQSEGVEMSAKTVWNQASESSLAMDQVTQSINDITQATGTNNQGTSDIFQASKEVYMEMEHVAVEVKESLEFAHHMVQIAQQGTDDMEKVVSDIERIKEFTQKMNVVIDEVDQSATEIGQILEMISAIASQTNLLALNAAIEAARAGEHGKGFAVVAEEIKKLADQTSKATKEITDLIVATQTNVKKVVSAIGESSRLMEQGVQRVKGAGSNFDLINDKVEEMEENLSQIVSTYHIIVNKNDAIVKRLLDTSQTISTSLGAIAAASEQQSESLKVIVTSAEELSETSRELVRNVHQFTVEA
ncbi:HAMP domain-containing protein [Heliobacillus mobilis]|uniref:HAMP domain-containing protein n=1 Tax=Heliobacterium mobile TaxID=28064 RepID=A0A6I3SIX0_HELMO|nr:methyl-accepting chemotaxis protein [Heliobacterium mobile]MTV48766.1 HAMP domain-containing protein [Heliobacterium mobile]